jgi:hypothetical protein
MKNNLSQKLACLTDGVQSKHCHRNLRELGLTVVSSAGRHAEMAAIFGASSLGLMPTTGVTTNIICPQCAVALYNLGAKLIGARTFTFKP